MNAPIKFWSYSALKRFEKCAYEIYLDRVMKNPKPEIVETSPLERGNRVHKAAEAYVKGEGQLVGELGIFASEFERLKEAYGTGTVQVEDSWWFKRDWSESDWEDPDKWAIIKCDVVEWVSQTHMDVTDWKTGKSFGNEVSHDQQMMLYAIAAFMKYAALNTVRVKLGYLDEAPPYRSKDYNRSQIPILAERFAARGQKLVDAVAFPPRPSKSSCKYCSFGPNNGGTGACAYGIEL